MDAATFIITVVDLGVGLLVEKENKNFQITGQKSA